MSTKFQTLTHNGPIFPEEYSVKGFKLAGENLSALAEEMLWHYAAKRDTDYVKIDRFNTNFFKCLKPELTPNQQKLNFPADYNALINQMFNKNQELKEAKSIDNKKVTQKEFKLAENDPVLLEKLKKAAEKYEAKQAEKDAMKEKYGFAMLDGKKQPLGSYMIEGPGIMMTRGDSSILGMWKYRTVPEDVTINYCSNDMTKAPKAPVGHSWKEIISDRNSHQTVMYFVQVGRPEFSISPRYKRIIFGGTSDVKGNADQHKFEKARKLVENWNDMEAYIRGGLVDTNPKRVECAVIASLIQTTGVRVGTEKDADAGYADTVGVATFKVENLKLESDNKISLDFMGKDSVRYVNTVQLDPYTYKALKNIVSGKKPEDMVFSASATDVGNFLKEFMPECTAKLFRTAYGCKLISEELHKAEANGTLKKNMTQAEKLHVYDLANLAVAKKLNHQRALPKNFDAQMEKLDGQIEAAIVKEAETKSKAEKELASILEQANLAKKEWSGEKLEKALARIKERKEKIAAKVEKSEAKIEELKTKKDFKGMTANYALNTSRTNYSTPSLAVGFCKKFDIDISKIYSKSLLKKFEWALDTPASYYENFPTEQYGE